MLFDVKGGGWGSLLDKNLTDLRHSFIGSSSRQTYGQRSSSVHISDLLLLYNTPPNLVLLLLPNTSYGGGIQFLFSFSRGWLLEEPYTLPKN